MVDETDIRNIRGLSDEEARERLKEDGYNELPAAKHRSIFRIIADVLREPMFLLLVAGGLIYLVVGDLEEALMLLGFVLVVIGITIYQERKTERALEALRDLSSPRALVIRDGRQKRIAGRDVVRGDILILSEGDRTPADAVVLSSTNLSADESLLTGESVPVRKVAWDGVTEPGRPGGDDRPFVYSGTLIVSGRGIVRVYATGAHTELGKIGTALHTVKIEDTPLQKETRRLVTNLAVVGLFLCVMVVVVYGLTRGHWLNGFLAGIALAMAVLPEEFPVVLTVFLALGAWRISQSRVLTRRMPAIETLGAATVLCVDKTGTLTENRMVVEMLYANDQFYDLHRHREEPIPENFHELVEFSILASQVDPFDPMERAINELGVRYLEGTEHIHNNWTLIREYPLSKKLLAMSRVWRSPDGREYVIAAKGAPEAITDLCHLSGDTLYEIDRRVAELADKGLRVLGVARAFFEQTTLPGEQHDFHFEFLGLIGLADPIRPAVPMALRECYDAGVRVVMITGDYPGTARNIARQIGLRPADEVISGDELDRMSDTQLRERIKNVNIFARVVPEQKLRLVNALKENGEVVAMTGDGVNDAPALKSANIGIAMGGRGTDVARESSALVLLDDDFSSIVRSVRMGRRIFDNIRKATSYIFAIHVPIAGMSLLPVLFGWPLILLPVHIAFLELIIDPVCSIVFEAEPEEADVMHRPPRSPQEPLYSRRAIVLSLLQGLAVLVIVMAIFTATRLAGRGDAEARALSFTTLIIANLCLILTNRSWSRIILHTLHTRNNALWWVIGGALLFLGLVLYVPFLRSLFRLAPLHADDLLICLTAGAFSVAWFEMLKIIMHYTRRGSLMSPSGGVGG